MPLKDIKVAIYDLETLSNCCTFCFLDYQTGKKREFVLYDDPDLFQLKELCQFLIRLKKEGYYLLGFNNINFDAQILEFILDNVNDWINEGVSRLEIMSLIKEKSQSIINLDDAEKFTVLIPEWKCAIRQIDLFRQKHYDRKEKATSLKWLQFTLRYPTVEEMPFPHDAFISKEDVPKVLEYNWNDVDSTLFFFKEILHETETRLKLSEQYGLKLLNASEPKMVREIFGKLLSEDMGISYQELKKKQTFRSSVNIGKIIFPYVNFKTDECKYVLKWFNELTVNPNVTGQTIEKEFTIGGIKGLVALGGIHACISPGRYKSNNNLVIRDVDVKSFYPNLAIQNNVKPAHLGESFNKIYKNIYEQRIQIPKTDPINYIFKIILNSTYGLSKEKNGYLYDPLFTYTITVNGQLTLLMLAERLVMQIPDLVIFQMNTDGLTLGYEPQYTDSVDEILKKFSEHTKLELEDAYYKEMIIRDVNNYMGIYEGDKEPKKKGIFETCYNWKGNFATEHHKNPSFNIIPLAIEAYFVKGEDYRKFIENYKNVYDFLGGVKKKHNFELILYSLENNNIVESLQQKVTRFYVSRNGSKFYKKYNDFETNPNRKSKGTLILKDWKVGIANVINQQTEKEIIENLDYRFYIKEVEKIITSIEGDSCQLTLMFEAA